MKKFDFNDILISPAIISDVESRYNDINPYHKTSVSHLPLIAAPMSSVVDLNNFNEYIENNILVTLPRTVTYDNYISKVGNDLTNTFISYGLQEFEDKFIKNNFNKNKYKNEYALIDVANGHMSKIFDLVNQAKKNKPNLVIMVGNIGNPETYREYALNTNVDFIRVGLGNGNGCITTKNSGVGYPQASLINECFLIKKELEKNKQINSIIKLPKIVADGGMKDYDDIIKALALGADYVMIGSMFNKAIESCGDSYLFGIKLSQNTAKTLFDMGLPIKKQFYGMSTKLAQKKMGKTNLKTSEGVIRYRKVEYYLDGWVENFEHYLRNAMSYLNTKTLNDFIGKVNFNLITENSFKRFNK